MTHLSDSSGMTTFVFLQLLEIIAFICVLRFLLLLTAKDLEAP